ncbi:MFS transporter [Kribbella sp. VKM Ac-2566]|uniref:MFS transporter n=1 Tax=Kribbella sp. VKM Ac-2566 TaxID=2512218 RepID=UPI0010DC8ED9|nr:MFS transporter [Kribbella sp. VKM Ac-2566]TDX08406.1 putative MFS family arabinose efflux permease [Kribbella sp. VKM Ac-2566]
MDLTTYRDLWKTQGVMALLASALVARLPMMAVMVPLSFLAKDAAGNFGWAGVVAGAYSIGTAVASVAWSRMADRRGARRVVIGTGTAWGVLTAVVALLPDSWFRLLPALAALVGLFVPPIMQALRASWPTLVQGARLSAVYALDATAQELLFLVGPLLGALAVSFASPRIGLLTCAVTAAVAIWWFGLKQRPRTSSAGSSEPRPTARQLVVHQYRLPLLLTFTCLAMGFASLSLGMVAFAEQHGNRLIAGVLETVVAFGSLSGGLVSGALPGRRNSYVWRRTLLLGVLVTGCVFATFSVVALAVTLFAFGCMIAPTVGAISERVGVLTPSSARTEVFGWMLSGGMVGSAVGSATAGALVEAFGVPAAWALMAGLTVLATLTLLRVPPHRPAGPSERDVAAPA